MRYSVDLQKIPEHERRYLEQDPALAEQVLPEPPLLSPREQALLDFFLEERSATPAEQPIDRLRALDLYERLYAPTDGIAFVGFLRAMDQEFFASRAAKRDASPPFAEGEV